MSSRTVLIVGIDYWPDVTGIAPYTTQFAEYLAERGDLVHVVTGMPYYPEWTIKSGYGRKLRVTERRNGVTLHRRRQYVPSKQSAIRRAGYEGSFFLQSLLPPRMPKPDVIIGVIPALAGGAQAARLARHFDAPLSLWIQDLMGKAAEQSGIQGGGRIVSQAVNLERWIATQARSIGIIAEGFRPYLEQLGVPSERIHHIRNWSHITGSNLTSQQARSTLSLPQSPRICMHTGNMGLKQGLETVIEAARVSAIQHPNLLYLLIGDGNQRSRLEAQAAGLSNVRFIDPVSEAQFPVYLAAADVLILSQRGTVEDMSLPSKLTSYVAATRPIVASVSPRSEAARFVRGLPLGVLVYPDNATLLAETCATVAENAKPSTRLTSHIPVELQKGPSMEKTLSVLCGS